MCADWLTTKVSFADDGGRGICSWKNPRSPSQLKGHKAAVVVRCFPAARTPLLTCCRRSFQVSLPCFQGPDVPGRHPGPLRRGAAMKRFVYGKDVGPRNECITTPGGGPVGSTVVRVQASKGLPACLRRGGMSSSFSPHPTPEH